MPSGQPFTSLCSQLSQLTPSAACFADLHLHTIHSDGRYAPAEVVSLAQRSGLSAIAVTDHDTVGGVAAARIAAQGSALTVVPGVEISAEHQGRELHLLAYFVDCENEQFLKALGAIRRARTDRFLAMINRLRAIGVNLTARTTENRLEITSENGTVTHIDCGADASLGRRTLAEHLVQHRKASSVREAFHRYLADGGRADVPKRRLPIAEAIEVAHAAGGVTSWAHPPENVTLQDVEELRVMGLDAVEARYPHFRPRRTRQLREWATHLQMGVTGGSDCHGPDEPRRAIGCCGVSREELADLVQRRP